MKKDNFWKKFIVLPIICLMFMVGGTVSAETAPSTVTVSNESILSSKYYICVNGYSDSEHCFKAPVHYVTVNGNSVPAYCIEEDLKWYNVGASLSKKDEVTDPGYIYLLLNGTPSALGLDKEKAGYVTQLAVWWYTDIKNGTNYLNKDFKGNNFSSIYSDPENLYSKIKALVQGAQNAKSSSTSSSSGTLQFIGSTKMTYSSDRQTLNATIHAQVSSLTDAKVYSQTGFTDNSGILTYSGNTIQIKLPIDRIPSGNLKGSITIWAEASGGTSSTTIAYKYRSGDASYQNLLVPITTTSSGTINGTYTVNFERTKLVIKKVDENGTRLADAVFQITDANGNMTTVTSNSSSDIEIYDLAPGTATIKETYAPTGYKEASPTTVRLVAGTTTNVTIKNTKEGTTVVPEEPDESFTPSQPNDYTGLHVWLEKRDENGKRLAGAKMKFSCESSGFTLEFTSTSETLSIDHTTKDSKGRTMIPGEVCTLEELVPPTGYEKSNKVVRDVVEASTNGNTVFNNQFYIENSKIKKADIPISKQDATTGKELPGAHLVLKDATGKTIDEWNSGNEPHVVKDLADGVYTLHETIAPDGYVLTSSISFIVKDGKVDKPVVMKNEATKVNFEKR